MRAEDYAKLLEDLKRELISGAGSVGILGFTGTTLRLLASLAPCGLLAAVEAVYTPEVGTTGPPLSVPLRPFKALAEAHLNVLVVAADDDKEGLLLAALPLIQGTPKVIVAGATGTWRFVILSSPRSWRNS